MKRYFLCLFALTFYVGNLFPISVNRAHSMIRSGAYGDAKGARTEGQFISGNPKFNDFGRLNEKSIFENLAKKLSTPRDQRLPFDATRKLSDINLAYKKLEQPKRFQTGLPYNWQTNASTNAAKDGETAVFCYTDDTMMTEFLAKALLEAADKNCGFEDTMKTIAKYFKGWLPVSDQGDRRSPGNACFYGAKRLVEDCRNWNTTGGFSDGGCGSVMRVSPIAMAFHKNPRLAETIAYAQSLITHGDPSATVACAALARLMCELLNGKDPMKAIQTAITTAKNWGGGPIVQFTPPGAKSVVSFSTVSP